MSRIVRYISILFKCIGIASIAMYIYNSISAAQKYNSISEEAANTIQLYLIIGIGAIVIGIIVKLISNMLLNKEVAESEEIVEDQKECRNCKALISKDSYICPSCGYVEPKENIEEPKEEPKEEEIIDNDYVNKYYNDDVKNENKDKQALLIRVLPKLFLIIFIFVSIYVVYLFSFGDNKNNLVSDKKLEFLNYAVNISSDISIDELELSESKVYFTLTDLNYVSNDYDCDDSYIVIDNTSDEYFIILLGKGEYSDYGIDYTNVEELNISKVLTNHTLTKDVNDTLLIDSDNKVIIYNKN